MTNALVDKDHSIERLIYADMEKLIRGFESDLLAAGASKGQIRDALKKLFATLDAKVEAMSELQDDPAVSA